MKKQKLNLNELKVRSFVTTNDELDQATIKGGFKTHIVICHSEGPLCSTYPTDLC